MNPERYIYKKEIDWSALHIGINIPVVLQDVFYKSMKFRLRKGESKKIKLIIEGNEYRVMLINISFDEQKYPNHKELLQIRYSRNSTIAKLMKDIFNNSYDYLRVAKEMLDNKRKQLSVPIKQREYLAIYSTSLDDVFYVECFTNHEISQVKQTLKIYSEQEIEQIMNLTDSASIIKKDSVVKIRKLDNSIGDMLKIAYGYRCQICGLLIGGLYGVTPIHVHHMEYFSKSLNNNAENIMVICPNHHSIVHATDPLFDRKMKTFTYPNGYTEGLKLNLHL